MANSFQEDLMSFLYKHKDSNQLIEINDILRRHDTVEQVTKRNIVLEYETKKIIRTDNTIMKIGMKIQGIECTLDNTITKAMLTPVDGVIFAQTHYVRSWSDRNQNTINLIIGIISGVLGSVITLLIQELLQ